MSVAIGNIRRSVGRFDSDVIGNMSLSDWRPRVEEEIRRKLGEASLSTLIFSVR